ncbi:hypothetical protein GF325_04945 [Candidatus Bathyarchaeota archaeon]|nr:hypothetical protein [Candidatus Bathyarchaeota archaeon]
MKTPSWLKYGVPAILLGSMIQGMMLLETGDPLIDFLSPIMPFLGEFLNFFASFIMPFGQLLADNLIGPTIELLPGEGTTGLAIYFTIFAGIFLVSMWANVMWKPRGYDLTENKEKQEDEEESGELSVIAPDEEEDLSGDEVDEVRDIPGDEDAEPLEPPKDMPMYTDIPEDEMGIKTESEEIFSEDDFDDLPIPVEDEEGEGDSGDQVD